MPNAQSQREMERAPSIVRPLQTEGRHREPHVTALIAALCRASPIEVCRRAAITDREHSEFICEEALAYLLREAIRAGDRTAAGTFADILMKRTAPFIRRHVRAWKSLSAQHADDCIYDVTSQMLVDLFDLSAGCEFWEIRFLLCLKRRVVNCAQRYRQLDEAEFQPPPLGDGSGNETSFFDMRADLGGLTPHLTAEINEALAHLPDRERIVFILYHLEEWTQPEIAERLKMTDRTVRNILGRAEKILAGWRVGIAN